MGELNLSAEWYPGVSGMGLGTNLVVRAGAITRLVRRQEESRTGWSGGRVGSGGDWSLYGQVPTALHCNQIAWTLLTTGPVLPDPTSK